MIPRPVSRLTLAWTNENPAENGVYGYWLVNEDEVILAHVYWSSRVATPMQYEMFVEWLSGDLKDCWLDECSGGLWSDPIKLYPPR